MKKKLNLVNRNKIKKYLIYAIGEISLVVIGILIALQINNWNQNRKKNIQEKETAVSVFNELEQNLQYTKQQKESTKIRISYLEKLLELTSVESEGISESEDYTKPRILGAQLKKNAEQGFQYLSVRNQGSTCWGLFSPIHVSKAIQTKHFEFIFDGKSISKVRELVSE